MSTAELRAAPVFAALCDRTRLSLLMKLSDGGARSIAALSADTRLSRQAVTKHLHVLEDAGLVRSARMGRERSFSYRPERVVEVRAYLDRVAGQWDDALSRLREFVED
jgi:DNA-binding transcriptional ArsR family regulator